MIDIWVLHITFPFGVSAVKKVFPARSTAWPFFSQHRICKLKAENLTCTLFCTVCVPASVWSVCSDPCTATFHCIEPECVRGYAGYSYVPCRSQSVFVRPPAQPIAPVWVKTDHRYLQQPAQLQLIQQFVIVVAGRPWYMMENVCRMCCISTWKNKFYMKFSKCKHSEKQACKSAFWIFKICLYFAYLLHF